MTEKNLPNECRVTLVMPSASPTGGAEEAFLHLLRSEAASQFAWQILFLESGPLAELVIPLVKESFVVPCGRTREIWKWWQAANSIKRHAEKFGSDLILGWMSKGHVYGGLAARLSGISAAWYQVAIPDDCLIDRASRQIRTKAVFVCSEFVAELQRAKQGNANVIAIRNGVDLSRFEPAKLPSPEHARKELGLPVNGPILGMVGRLQRWKGMHVLIAAMPAILEQHPNAHCVIVGGAYPAEPGYERELHLQARSMGLCEKIHFAGAQSNVPLWMQAMDVVIHASEREPFGIVVVEAMALGKAVVAAVPGGPAEIIHDGVDGLLAVSSDVPMLTERINQLLGDSLLRETLGRRASQVATSQFSSEAFAQKLCEELRRLVI